MLSKRQVSITILKSAVKSGAAIAVSLLVIIFFSRQIIKISNSVQEKVVLNSVLEKGNDTALMLKNDFKLIDGKDVKIEAALMSVDNILEFVGDLEDLAKRHSLEQTVRFSNPAPAAIAESKLNLYSIDYTITFAGNSSSLVNFLKDFEKLPYFTGVSSITLNAASSGDWEKEASIFMQAKLYVKGIGNN